MNNKLVILLAGLSVLEAIVIGFLAIYPLQNSREASLDPENEELRQKVQKQDLEIADLRKSESELKTENQDLHASLKAELHRGGMNPSASGTGKSGHAENSPPNRAETNAPQAASAPGAGKKKPLPWKELATELMEIIQLSKAAGDKPTPELMSKYGALMSRIADIQGKLGYADPGLVTSSPAFLANVIDGMLEQEGQGLSNAERAQLYEAAENNQSAFHQAVSGPDTPYALEKTGGIVDSINAFKHETARVLGPDRFKGTTMAKEARDEGKLESTAWPEHSMTGVKDLDEAAKKLSERWISRMGLPKSEAQAISDIAREFAGRSHEAQARVPRGEKGTLTNAQRHALDRELAGYQIDALKRLNNLNLDEKTRDKVKAYNSLDRVEIGGKGSWSRSGSFGNFQFSSSSEEETD